MSDRECNDLLFETLAKILIRSFVAGVVLLVLWFLVFLIGGDWAYRIHSKVFDITQRDFYLMNYYGMAFVKVSAFLFFLLPYLSIRLTLSKKKESS